MKKIVNHIILFLFTFSGYQTIAQTNMDNLVPDVSYNRKADRTYIFSRTQFIYSLGADDYLHRWVDRPLYINTDLDKNKPASALMSLQSYEEMQKMALKYGLDGFSFFPQTSRRSTIYDYTKETNLPNFKLLTEFTGDAKSKTEVIQMAKNNPAPFRINGRIVITSYNADQEDLGKWQQQLKQLYQQFPNQFYFLPSLVYFGNKPVNYWQKRYTENKITSTDINGIKDYLRKWARATDGLYFSNAAGVKNDQREFDANFYKNFIIRLMKSVLAEPEFKGKLFGLSAVVGHENVTRIGYGLNSDGTQTLRNSMEIALAANPDLINIPEWDEQNENTSLRPTVMNGLSSLRIMRYYTALNKDEKLTPLQDDDSSIPNLVISYRKILVLGKKLQIELLDIPDGPNAVSYNLKLTLKDINGNIVYQSPEKNFSNKAMKGETIELPSENYAQYEVLIPSLEIKRNNKTTRIENGLDFIELRPTFNWNYKWVKQDIRDILSANNIDFRLSTTAFKLGETITATASFACNEPLAQVEILQNDDVKYSYSKNDQWHENENQLILSLTAQAMGGMQQGLNLSGSITLENASGKWLLLDNNSYAPTIKNQTISFDGARASIRKRRILIAIPKAQIATGILNIQIPGIYTGKIAVKEIVDKWIFGIAGPKGFNLVISRYVNQVKIPENINQKSALLTTLLAPDNQNVIYQLRAIGISGKIYRSKPIVSSNNNGPLQAITVYSDIKNGPVNLSVEKSRLPEIEYNINPDHGSVLTTNAGRNFWGILGGYFAQATERGGANAGDDIAFISGKGYPPNAVKTAPDWVNSENEYALQFDGKGTFVSLPQGVIPSQAAYSMNLEFRINDNNKKQILLANRGLYLGSIVIYSEEGKLKFDFAGRDQQKRGVVVAELLPRNVWIVSTVTIGENEILFKINGTKEKSVSISGPGQYPTPTVFGGYGDSWFLGSLRTLSIRHGF